MIEVRNLTKSYPSRLGRHYVFRDLSFTVPENRSVAIIGRNGAGKSTLMRILGGIDFADRGEIVTQKRFSWPLGMRGGYHAELSGREIARFVLRVYGMDRQEMEAKIDYVNHFAELGKFFDLPTRTYSSGMQARLAFGMSLVVDFDYYLIDELTAVGDRFFKKKSIEAFAEKRKQASVIMASHSLNSLKDYCDIGIVMEKGEVTIYPTVEEAIEAYERISQ